MWQVSVIFVPAMTALHPIPMLWCGVSGETVKKSYIFQHFLHKTVSPGSTLDLLMRWQPNYPGQNRDIKLYKVFYNPFLLSLRYNELCTKVWAFLAVQQQLKRPKNFTVSPLTPHQSLGFGYASVVMCTNITLTCHINYIGSAQTSPELWVFY